MELGNDIKVCIWFLSIYHLNIACSIFNITHYLFTFCSILVSLVHLSENVKLYLSLLFFIEGLDHDLKLVIVCLLVLLVSHCVGNAGAVAIFAMFVRYEKKWKLWYLLTMSSGTRTSIHSRK